MQPENEEARELQLASPETKKHTYPNTTALKKRNPLVYYMTPAGQTEDGDNIFRLMGVRG